MLTDDTNRTIRPFQVVSDYSPAGDQPTAITLGGASIEAIKNVWDVNGGGLEQGDTLLYQITLRNTTGYEISDVDFVDVIPANTNYVADSVSAPTGSVVVSASPTLEITVGM